jgi:predicted lipoprotein with Yx(FWY)xxD motif
MTLVKTAPAHILVDAKGMTLYVFAKDSKNKSTCTGQCATYWPAAMVPAGAKAPGKMTGMMGTIGEMMLKGGGAQLTYDGAPLYTFANDKKAGDVNGEGVGGIWWAVVVGSGM